ncbi:hypothetical protein D9611_013489 [Ephemerocybe angulata]|uniref:Uncharacterized protein n=1 Tax=Ephemerocybe angulata TaxID=980116 RepID=A0A8H5BTW4_9AGAR|nr:hypothetical protein D9611_013489 [Tulosesus angulatus]
MEGRSTESGMSKPGREVLGRVPNMTKAIAVPPFFRLEDSGNYRITQVQRTNIHNLMQQAMYAAGVFDISNAKQRTMNLLEKEKNTRGFVEAFETPANLMTLTKEVGEITSSVTGGFRDDIRLLEMLQNAPAGIYYRL